MGAFFALCLSLSPLPSTHLLSFSFPRTATKTPNAISVFLSAYCINQGDGSNELILQ